MNRLLFILMLCMAGCIDKVPQSEKDEYVRQQIRSRIDKHIDKEKKNCDDRILESAQQWVDSTFRANPMKFLGDSIQIPPKPVRPLR